MPTASSPTSSSRITELQCVDQPQLFDNNVFYEWHDYAAAFGPAHDVAIPLLNNHQTTSLILYVRECCDNEACR